MMGSTLRLILDGTPVDFWVQPQVRSALSETHTVRGLCALRGRELSVLEEPAAHDDVSGYTPADLARLAGAARWGFPGDDALALPA